MADVEINLETTNSQTLIGLGLRAYAIGDFSSAAAAFGRATQLLAQEHGDEHDSLGEVYLNYGKALLEVSREESEPLGDAIPQGESDSDSEEGEGENGVSSSTENKEDVENAEEESKAATDEKKDDAEAAQNGDTKEADGINEDEGKSDENKIDGSGDGPSEEAEKAEECTDLQLAWEVLEVAKRIFMKRDEGGKSLLSETLILLGEVSMESENFTDGVNDIKEGLELQKTIYEPTSRKLAESYYKLGIALATVSNIEESITHFKMSIDTLKKRIEMLREMMKESKKEDEEQKVEETKNEEVKDEKKTEEGNDEKKEKNKTIKRTKTEDEIKEIEDLIPEIEEKINDTKSIKEEMVAKFMMKMSNNVPKKDGASSSKAATDISHLVKRKRKDDEDAAETSDINPSKKPSP